MKFYVITEMVGFDSYDFMTTNNHTKEQSEAFSMFLTRRKMILDTHNVRVIKDDYDLINEWGFLKVMLENGCTIEIGMSMSELV